MKRFRQIMLKDKLKLKAKAVHTFVCTVCALTMYLWEHHVAEMFDDVTTSLAIPYLDPDYVKDARNAVSSLRCYLITSILAKRNN